MATQQKPKRYHGSLHFSAVGGGWIMLSCLKEGIKSKLNLESTLNLMQSYFMVMPENKARRSAVLILTHQRMFYNSDKALFRKAGISRIELVQNV